MATKRIAFVDLTEAKDLIDAVTKDGKVRVPATPCPWCGTVFDGATHTEHEEEPGPGDVCICFGCANWCIFDERLHRIKATPKQIKALERRKDCRKAKRMVLEAHEAVRHAIKQGIFEEGL